MDETMQKAAEEWLRIGYKNPADIEELLATQRTALLTKLREGVAEIYTYTKDPNYQHELILRHQVEALIEKLEAGE
jgi:hypothetical protein